MAIVIFIIGIMLFISLIVLHEFGHFIAARRNGVDVEEYAIFFGPTIYKRKTKNGWLFRFNSVPLGGYVKLKGEHDSDVEKGSYGAASLWVKTKIMTAGVFANLVIAVVLMTIVGLIGIPQIIPNQFNVKSNMHVVGANNIVKIGGVLKDSPAAKTDLKNGDDITYIGPKGNLVKITSVASLQSVTKQFAGQKVYIDFTRNNKPMVTSAILNSNTQVSSSQQKVYLGVSLDNYSSGVELVRYTWAAPIVSVGLTKQLTILSAQGLGHAIKGLGGIAAGVATSNNAARKNAQTTASSQFVGPYGIYEILRGGSTIGFQFVLFFVAYISLALAIMNILPIPALDGGRLWLTLGSRAIKKPLPARTEELINAVGLVVLLILVCVITYADIKRFH